MKTQVTAQVTAEVAQALRQGAPPTSDSQDLSQLVKEHGAVLEAIHPETEDPLLTSWFTVEAPDMAVAEQVAASLQQRRAVKACYIKPPDALP